MANDSVRPRSLENISSNVFRPTSQAELLRTWRRHQPWIIVACMLLVAASVIISLLLLQHDEPIAPVALAPKTNTLPQPANKAVPDTVQTEKPVRGLVVKAAPASKQTSIPDKIETSAVTILDSEGNQSVEKISTGAASMNKTQKKIETGTSSKHKTQKKIETGTSSKHKTQEKVEIDTSSKHKTQKKVETGTSSKPKTQKKIKTHSSQPADDWKVIEHQ